MSIDSLIDTFGTTLYLFSPTYQTTSDGSVSRTYGKAATATGFLQPSSQSQAVGLDRMEGRTTVVIYFKPGTTGGVAVDWEIQTAELPAYRRFVVTGVTNPGELATTGAASRLNMTVVEAVELTEVAS